MGMQADANSGGTPPQGMGGVGSAGAPREGGTGSMGMPGAGNIGTSKYYISRIRFRGFKSFKSAEVELPAGFVALAGPNGSGKSNVTDAIRFVLGEMSLKSLRAKKVTELINMNSTKAEVTLFISGEKKFEIRRAIREDGKTSYHLDGRHLTRTQVLEALRPYGIETGSHNIIAQGQVQKIVEMNAKERRAIIDAAAGIAEFDDKKKEALSELGKVDTKISEAKIMLSTQGAYLAELEKEKDAALSYQDAQARLAKSRATLVHMEYEKLDRHFNDLLKKRKEASDELEKLEKEAGVLDKRRAELEEKRKALGDKVGSNKELEKLLAMIETLKVQLGQAEVRLEEKGNSMRKIEEEMKAKKDEQARIKSALDSMADDEKKQLDELAKMKGEVEEKRKRAGVPLGGATSDADALAKLSDAAAKLGVQKASLEATLSGGGEISRMYEEQAQKAFEEIERIKASAGGSDGKIEKYRDAVKSFGAELDKLFEKEKDLNRKLPSLDKDMLEKKETVAALRGSVSVAAQNPALLFVMALKKDGERGIYGTVADIVDIDEKYRVAAEASAGSRLTYVIVDTLDTANRIISKLKEGRQGRCTFIPLDRPITEVEKAGAGKAGLGKLSDYVKYDRQYWPAISYVFGDTVLCSSVAEAKKLGIGNYRMVTIDGELIERSGIVTGGSMRGSIMARSSLLKAEAEVEELKKLRDGTFAELYGVREQMQRARKERAEAEIKIRSIEAESGGEGERQRRISELEADFEKARADAKKNKDELDGLKAKLAKTHGELAQAQAALEDGRKKAAAEEERRKKTSGEAQRLYQEIFEKYTNLESSVSSRKREWGMIAGQLKEAADEFKKMDIELKTARRTHEEMESERGRLSVEKEKSEAQLREISAGVQKLYDQMQALQKELDDLGAQKGKIEFARDSRRRECNEIDVKKASAETKLADLKAEWEKFSGTELLDAPRNELEEMVKSSEAKIQSLGNVNLKAPEVYGQRRKEHDELSGKVSTLESEKGAVMRLIDEIEQKKRNIFMNTFHEINAHFSKLFKLVFRGEGVLLLEEPSNPLETGLSFRVRGDQDKKDRYLNSMSGGEQTLLSMMFIFALQMHKPAPFYILDEVEAALDKENSNKMADFVRQMSRNAQFIVVTHNDAVLSAADVALGVMKTDGGSKIVGVQLAGAIPLAPENKPPIPPDETKKTGAEGEKIEVKEIKRLEAKASGRRKA